MQSEFRSSNVGTEWNYELRSEQEGENMQESSGQRKSIERETRGQSQHRGKPLRQTQRRTDAGGRGHHTQFWRGQKRVPPV